MKWVETEDFGTPTLVAPSSIYLRLFNYLHYLYHFHAQNGYAHASSIQAHRYSLVDPDSRSPRTLRRGKQPARMMQALIVLIYLTALPRVLTPRTEYLLPRSSCSRARVFDDVRRGSHLEWTVKSCKN